MSVKKSATHEHLPYEEGLNELNDNDETECDENESEINEEHETTHAA